MPNESKTKLSTRIDTELLALCDEYIQKSHHKNRTAFIGEAMRFYLGYLTSKTAADYLLQSVSSVLRETVQCTEDRLSRLEFKTAVELSKLVHVMAHATDIDAETLDKLHVKCTEEVRAIGGAINFEAAHRFQKGQ